VAKADELECIRQDAGDPELRLPKLSPLDADARPHCVVDRVSEDLARFRSRRMRKLDGLSEEERELRPARAELVRRREPQVDLQTAGEQKDALNRTLAREVEEYRGVKRLHEVTCPLFEYVFDRALDSERQVEIGPAVSFAGERPD
jgi:hypothetical protein